MKIFKRRGPRPGRRGSAGSPDLHGLALPELTRRAESNPFLKVLLAEVERGRQRCTVQLTGPYPGSESESGQDVESAPLHAYEIGPDDAHVIRMMAGAHFKDSAQVGLPSGKTISGAEMRRWIEAQDT